MFIKKYIKSTIMHWFHNTVHKVAILNAKLLQHNNWPTGGGLALVASRSLESL